MNVGCVPKKIMWGVANYLSDTEMFTQGYGVTRGGEQKFNFEEFKKKRDMEVKRLNGIYEKNILKSGVEIIQGEASFLENHTIKIGEETLTAPHVLVATGSKPFRLQFPGEEFTINSDGFFALDHIPKRTLIVGGGYIAIELSQILA